MSKDDIRSYTIPEQVDILRDAAALLEVISEDVPSSDAAAWCKLTANGIRNWARMLEIEWGMHLEENA